MEWSLQLAIVMKKLGGLLLLGALVGFSTLACSADVPDEEEEARTMESALGGSAVCRVAANATIQGVRVTVRSGAVTAGCVAVAWTAAGVGEAGCLAPAAGTALSAVVTALAGGVAWLTCGEDVMRVMAAVSGAASGTQTPAQRKCETEPLSAECDVTECLRRENLKGDLCNNSGGGNCPAGGDTDQFMPNANQCRSMERIMNVSRNCINARRDVMRCFKQPDYGGHQTAIIEQCNRFRKCVGWVNKCAAESLSNPPLPLPTPCQ